jgi:hypothetical protein
MRMEPTGYRVPGRSLSHGRSRALTNCCERLIGRNFSAGFIDVVHVSYTLPDNVLRATIEAGFLVLVVGRNISVGALAQNLHLLPPLHV